MIEKLTCHGYRGFSKEQTLNLAIPDGTRGSGLTVLVGPNGAGKSTLLECFAAIAKSNVSFTNSKRNKLAQDKIRIKILYDSKSGTLATVPGGGSKAEWIGPTDKPQIYYLPSRREFNPYFGKDPSGINPENNPQNNITYKLFDVNKKSKEFNKIFWRILGRDLEWMIDQNDAGYFYVKEKKDNSGYHKSNGLAEGIVSLLFIVEAIFEAKPNELIVIDEPERSLHPQIQARLLNEILELTKFTQVVISTHSVNMISIESAINKGVIARVHEESNTSVISCIDDICRVYLKSYSNDLYNPQIITGDVRSCFFAEDGYIITKGLEDIMVFSMVLNQLKIPNVVPFIGFGTGETSSITQIAYLLKCLGFSFIGAIFDGDKQEDYDKFVAKYSDIGYKAWMLPLEKVNKLKSDCNNTQLKEMFEEIIKLSDID